MSRPKNYTYRIDAAIHVRAGVTMTADSPEEAEQQLRAQLAVPHSPLLTEVINTVVEQLHAAAGAQGSTWHLLLVGEAEVEATDPSATEHAQSQHLEDIDHYR